MVFLGTRIEDSSGTPSTTCRQRPPARTRKTRLCSASNQTACEIVVLGGILGAEGTNRRGASELVHKEYLPNLQTVSSRWLHLGHKRGCFGTLDLGR